ncbi:molybdopterin-guanine dinucleotide biosynthesis protein A [Paenibacillus forsythiae]|uniref:Probable molybdenum cofactor guanylyltransferase n=2 Tax=Paenibacillus forsythiae TaxID=365616 RepID=A0ABU3H3X5_9BACL|nr:molybdenum cofactor guanylyltransferase [Paenibacillus forsythiae]MDT3425527.1 molybdopterin-guanine dinucleotide biosynthesis protein A [Paenibacillus forsythiae]
MRIAGILIAGGRSRRMGADKSLLEFGGIPAIARVAAALGEVAQPVTIASGGKEREEYRFLGLPQAADRFPDCGPLAGLHAGMNACDAEWHLAAPCDLPFASAEFMRYLVDAVRRDERWAADDCAEQGAGGLAEDGGAEEDASASADGRGPSAAGAPPGRPASASVRPLAVVPVSLSGKVQPLLGLYHKDALPSLEHALLRRRLKVMEWLEGLEVLYVPEAGFAGASSGEPSPLLNINTPEDYHAARERRV